MHFYIFILFLRFLLSFFKIFYLLCFGLFSSTLSISFLDFSSTKKKKKIAPFFLFTCNFSFLVFVLKLYLPIFLLIFSKIFLPLIFYFPDFFFFWIISSISFHDFFGVFSLTAKLIFSSLFLKFNSTIVFVLIFTIFSTILFLFYFFALIYFSLRLFIFLAFFLRFFHPYF